MSEERVEPKVPIDSNTRRDIEQESAPDVTIPEVPGKGDLVEHKWTGPTEKAPASGGTWRPQPRY